MAQIEDNCFEQIFCLRVWFSTSEFRFLSLPFALSR